METRTLSLVVGLCLPAIALSSPASDVAPAGLREVIVAFKTHFDIGYTDLASNIVRRYRTTMIDQALQVVDQSRTLPPEQQFVWTIPGWPMKKITEDWDGQTPERKGRIQQAFQEGRFVVHALACTTHTELLEPEDLVRGLGFASRLSRQAGQPLPRDAKMTDVPCHSWILPTLLRHAGVDFLHLGCNAASSSPDVPLLFWWEGPDGSRLLTMYSASGYGTELVPPKDWPHRTWLALENTGDNHGPPTPDEMKKLLAQAAERLPGVKVRIGRMSDFADAILAEKPDLPVVRGDMPDTWIHGPLCDPAGAQIARNIRPAFAAAESLPTLLRLWGVPGSDPTDILAGAREQSLLYGEHTWGGALYWVTGYGKDLKWNYGDAWKADRAAGRFTKLEASWAEHTAYIETAQNLLRPVLTDWMQTLARSTGVQSRRVVVFNPLPWKRDGIVRLQADGAAFTALKPAEGGPTVPVTVESIRPQTLWPWDQEQSGAVGTPRPALRSRGSETLTFLARDIPPGGYRTFVPVESTDPPTSLRCDTEAGAMENEFLKVTLDRARGGIRSVLDKRSKREWVDQQSDYALGQYLYERFDADQVAAYVDAYVKVKWDWAVVELGKPALPPAREVPYRAASPHPVEVRIERSPVSATATLRSMPTTNLAHAVTTKVVLLAGQPYLDIEVTVHDKPADNWPEAGWICLPVNAPEPQFRLGRLGGVVDPARDLVTGANHDLLGVNTGLTITDPRGRGVGICALDSPLVSLGRPGVFRYSREFVPKRSVAFVNLFNNHWTTNFRFWNEGTWMSRIRLWAVDRHTTEAGLIAPSLEARHPLLAALVEGQAGPLPVTQRGIEVSRPGVWLTAFGPNPDGPGLVLRLWEYSGVSSRCEVNLPSGLEVKEVQPVNLRGEPIGAPIPVNKGTFAVKLVGFAPASLLIRP
jgi:alpha-mannosidase